MKRRNFLSSLLGAPLALKARWAQFFVRKPVELCGAPILNAPVHPPRTRAIIANQARIMELMAPGIDEGEAHRRILKLIEAYCKVDRHRVRKPFFYCSRPLGHKGPHMLLNPSS